MDLSCDTAKLFWSQKTAEQQTGSALQSSKRDNALPGPKPIAAGSGHHALYEVNKPTLEAALMTTLTLI